MGLTVKGLDTVLAVLSDVNEKNVKPLQSDFCTDVAEAIAERAKPLMPGPDSGTMMAATKAERGQGRDFGGASVRVCREAYYWRFLEYGDGPDGIEHAMFMRARESTFADLDSVALRRFNERLAKLMTKGA